MPVSGCFARHLLQENKSGNKAEDIQNSHKQESGSDAERIRDNPTDKRPCTHPGKKHCVEIPHPFAFIPFRRDVSQICLSNGQMRRGPQTLDQAPYNKVNNIAGKHQSY